MIWASDLCKSRRFVKSDLSNPFAKDLAFLEDENQVYRPRIPPPQGAYRDRHGRGQRDAVDAKAA
jgi:hypothetical protein